MKKYILIILILISGGIIKSQNAIENKIWSLVARTDIDGKLAEADFNVKLKFDSKKGTYIWGDKNGTYKIKNKEISILPNGGIANKYFFNTCDEDFLRVWNSAYTMYFIYRKDPYKN